MCLIRLCTPRLDSDTSALSLRLERLENRLDKLCDGEVRIQPRSAAPADAGYAEPVRPADKPVIPTESKPRDIPKAALNNTENKANTADIPPASTEPPDDKPDWLFEGTGGDASPVNSGDNPETPPFDLDEPTAADTPVVPLKPEQEPVTEQRPSAAKPQGAGVADPQVAEILDRLPVILQAILAQVRVSLGESTVNISGYQKFQYDFLTTGDSKERLEKAAEEVLGRKVKMVFDGDDGADTQTAESDPVSDFLTKAESMGVKIKYKKSKN